MEIEVNFPFMVQSKVSSIPSPFCVDQGDIPVSSDSGFASLFERSLSSSKRLSCEGEVVQGVVLHLQHGSVIVDVGGKSEGMIPLSEFSDAEERANLKPGDKISVFVENYEDEKGYITLSKEKADRTKAWDRIEKAYETNELVEGTVVRRVKGGLAVKAFGLNAFLPGSQIGLRPVRDLDDWVGKILFCSVLKLHKLTGNIVLSRRAPLEKEKHESRTKTLEGLAEHSVVRGTIKNITDYGAFVDLGGVDGLLHITDMSWGRVNHPSDLFRVGDEVTVKVLQYSHSKDKERISLGLKQMKDDPWLKAGEKYWPGKKVQGKVLSLADYGAFVELESGIEGLVHLSEMSWLKKFKHPSACLEIGQEVSCQVLEMDAGNKRIGLGLKQLEPSPWMLFVEKYKPGDQVTGKVRSLTDYGLFINFFEGIDGMIHKSDLSWTTPIAHPGDMYKKGDEVSAIILSINHDEQKVSLGVKQIHDDPWEANNPSLKEGAILSCSVLSVIHSGVLVQVQPGIEGFIPRDHMLDDTLQPGQKIEAQVVHASAYDRSLKLAMQPS